MTTPRGTRNDGHGDELGADDGVPEMPATTDAMLQHDAITGRADPEVATLGEGTQTSAGNVGAADEHAAEKPVEDWVTGDEPMTGPQRSYLQTLAREAGEELPEPEPTKAAASQLIERLQRATGRIPADRAS